MAADLTPALLADFLDVGKMNIVYDSDCSDVQGTNFFPLALSLTGINETIFNGVDSNDEYEHCNVEAGGASSSSDDADDIKPQCFFYSPSKSCDVSLTYDRPDCYTEADVMSLAAEMIDGSSEVTMGVVENVVEALNDYESGVSALYNYSLVDGGSGGDKHHLLMERMGTVNRDALNDTVTTYGAYEVYCEYATSLPQGQCLKVEEYIDKNWDTWDCTYDFSKLLASLAATKVIGPNRHVLPNSSAPIDPSDYKQFMDEIYMGVNEQGYEMYNGDVLQWYWTNAGGIVTPSPTAAPSQAPSDPWPVAPSSASSDDAPTTSASSDDAPTTSAPAAAPTTSAPAAAPTTAAPTAPASTTTGGKKKTKTKTSTASIALISSASAGMLLAVVGFGLARRSRNVRIEEENSARSRFKGSDRRRESRAQVDALEGEMFREEATTASYEGSDGGVDEESGVGNGYVDELDDVVSGAGGQGGGYAGRDDPSLRYTPSERREMFLSAGI